jgi:iron complex transport system substrate-binding protein
MNNKYIALIVAAVVVAAGTASAIYFLSGPGGDGKIIGTDVDFVGRDITQADDLNGGIVAIGQDSFRWITYFGLADRCVMIDTNDRMNFMGKAFMFVGRALANVGDSDDDYTHANCAVTPGDVERIFAIGPSVVIVPENFYSEYANEYRSMVRYGLNVVSIGLIYAFLEPGTFRITDSVNAQIDLLQKVFSKVLDTDRGKELKEAINGTVEDILALSSQVTQRKSGYIGALAYGGAHGADSSLSYYMPFALAGVDNIMDSGGTYKHGDSGVRTYSANAISERIKDDTILFLCATGLFVCTDNTSKGIIQLFRDHEAYVAVPYIWTGMNFENVLVAAYQIMKDAYGILSQSELDEKINNVYSLFLGSSVSNRNIEVYGVGVPADGTTVFEDMCKMYSERRGNPVHGPITIAADGTLSYL